MHLLMNMGMYMLVYTSEYESNAVSEVATVSGQQGTVHAAL